MKKRQIITLLILCFGLFKVGFSQRTNLFEYINSNMVQMNATQQENFNKLINNDVFRNRNYSFVKFNDLNKVIENNTISLNIDSINCTELFFKTKYFEYKSESNYTWVGDFEIIDSCFCSDGQLLIISTNGKKFGRVNVNDDSYLIRDLGNNLNVILDIDEEVVGSGFCESGGSNPILHDEETIVSRTYGECPIKVLVLYTVAAQSQIGDIEQSIKTAVLQTNTAYKNSQISNVRLLVAGIELLPEAVFKEGFTAQSDVEGLKNIPYITNLRDNVYYADLVVVITHGKHYGKNFSGRVDNIGPDEDDAYAIVQASFLTAQGLSFAHETGHLIGGKHETCDYIYSPSSCHDDSDFGHAHAFTKCFSERQTIIFSWGTNVIPHFSNPDVKYGGKATGRDDRNNAKKLKTEACRVANFRTDNDLLLSAKIRSENDIDIGHEIESVCPCDVTNLSALVFGIAPGPIQYEWRTSLDGINFSEIQGTSQSFGLNTWDFCIPDNGEWCFEACLNIHIYVRLTITGSEGHTSQVTRQFIFDDVWPEQNQWESCNNLFEGIILTNNETENTIQIKTFPNPFNNYFDIVIESSSEQLIEIFISDAKGRIILPIYKGNIGIENSTFIVNLDHQLPKGNYIVNVKIKNNVLSKKVIKL